MFDIFAARYAWTIDEFYQLTEKQLSALIPVIQDAKRAEYKQQAALQGKKLKDAPSAKELFNNEVSEDDQKARDDMAKGAYNRLKDRFLQGKLNVRS